MSTIYGKEEIFWIALEAIGTVLAFSLAFIITLYATYKDRILPNLKASECKIEFFEGVEGKLPFSTLKMHPKPTFIKISWRLANKRRYFIFRRDASNIVTDWWLQKESERGEWKYSGKIEAFPYLPFGKDFPQFVHQERTSLEEGKYLLSLNFSIKDKTVGGHQETIEYPHK